MIKNDLWKAIESYRMAGGREEHWARRDALDSALDGMQAEVDELRAENANLRVALGRAADDIESWGAYASEYFWGRWGL